MLFPIWFFLSLVARQSHSLAQVLLNSMWQARSSVDLNYIIIRAVQGERPLDGCTCWYNYRPSDWRLSEVVLVLVVRFWFCATEDVGDKEKGDSLPDNLPKGTSRRYISTDLHNHPTHSPVQEHKYNGTTPELTTMPQPTWMDVEKEEEVDSECGGRYLCSRIVICNYYYRSLASGLRCFVSHSTTNTIIWMHGIDFNECMDTEGGVAYSTAGHSTTR